MTGVELNQIRRQLGMSRRQFGRALGMQGTPHNIFRLISRMECGEKDIGEHTAAIARAMVEPVTTARQ